MRLFSLLTLGATALACAAPQSTESVPGPPVLELELTEAESPSVVGDHVVYGLSITNVGDTADSGLRVKYAFDQEIETVSGAGATLASESDHSVVFDPLATLRPGETAEWRVVVRALESGFHRVQVGVSSDANNLEFDDATTRFRDYQD